MYTSGADLYYDVPDALHILQVDVDELRQLIISRHMRGLAAEVEGRMQLQLMLASDVIGAAIALAAAREQVVGRSRDGVKI